MQSMYLPREPGFHSPLGNSLRPAEWFKVDAPELMRPLNDAVRVDLKNPNLFDKQPLMETDAEYLLRLELLTEKDRAYMETESFKAEERKALEFRKAMMVNPSENPIGGDAITAKA